MPIFVKQFIENRYHIHIYSTIPAHLINLWKKKSYPRIMRN